jgi:ankyrin repeat protein
MTDAFFRDDTDEVLKLVINGESVNCVCISQERCTPIMCALWTGRLDVVMALFERGADLDMLCDDGGSMLHVASGGSESGLGDNLESIRWVLANTSIDVNSVDTEGWTSIMLALGGGHVEAATCLMERGGDIMNIDNVGSNALHYASKGGSREAVEWVLANGTIGVNSVDNEGYTSIMAALGGGHVEAAKCLVERGGDIMKVDSKGINALHFAAHGGSREAVEWCLLIARLMSTQSILKVTRLS